MDAWIDTYHAVRALTSRDTFVFLTDSAVGVPEEDNLRHLIVNLGDDAPLGRVVPFLTSKHPIDYGPVGTPTGPGSTGSSCSVLGGDARVGVPRSVEHAWQLRRQIRAHGRIRPWAAGPIRDRFRRARWRTRSTRTSRASSS